MQNAFDFVVVGGGSAGAVIAARLSEDPSCRVALLEAGDKPPEAELMPVACASLQKDPATDWAYTADPGKAGLGLNGRRVPVPRGKMLGGSSGLNYMAWVRGHPGDFDSWAAAGASGWSYDDVLPYFKKLETVTPSNEIVIDCEARGATGPLGVSVRLPVLQGAREFVQAGERTGMRRGDYNGRDRLGPAGVVSLMQTSTRKGKRSSTYRAFLEGDAERRPNLAIITRAHATRILLEKTAAGVEATGVEYFDSKGEVCSIRASKEVIVSAGAIGSPHLLNLSGIGPRDELRAAGVTCVVDSPHVGKHLKDHVQVPLFFPAPGIGVAIQDVAASTELAAVAQWQATGAGLPSSSLYDAAGWCSTGLGDLHSHDAQVACFLCGYTEEIWRHILNVDTAQFFGDPGRVLTPDAQSIFLLANPVLPHSEGEITIKSSDPRVHPQIRMNYFADPHDLKVMVAVLRRTFEIAANWPVRQHLGSWLCPPALAGKHGYKPNTLPGDALLEDLALHFSLTVYHLCCTCRIGQVVDARLRVHGVGKLRVADASVMPNIVSGNTNAPSIMIGEKAAEMVAIDHHIRLAEFVGEQKLVAVQHGN